MRAKEYFEGIRAEVVKTDKAREMLERMKAREGAKAQSYQTGSSGGDVSDPMESVSQRIDFEGKLRQRIADADAICMYYCQAETWGEIAEIMQCSQKWCRKLCEVGFKFIDRVGWAHIKNA